MASHLCHVGPLHHTWVWGGGRYWVKTPPAAKTHAHILSSHIHHSTSYGEVLSTLCAFEWHLTCGLLPHISHLKRTFPSCVFSSNLILRISYHTLCTLEGLASHPSCVFSPVFSINLMCSLSPLSPLMNFED